MRIFRRKQKPMTPKRIIITVTTVVGISFVIAFGIYFIDKFTTETVNPDAPTFTTVTPNAVSVDELGGWRRNSPPEAEPVYVYIDEIDGVRISVSQQELPQHLQTNLSSQLTDLAAAFGSTEKINSSPDIYIGNSAQGPQSVITSKNSLLILLKSETGIEHDAWISYINSLR